MKVRAIRSTADGCPNEVQPFLAANISVTLSTEYEVHALTTFNGVTLLQIVDDLRYPSWQPAWLFEVIDTDIASDWICNVFGDGSLVAGPRFVAESEEAYAEMIELASDQVERFWSRVDSITPRQTT